MTIPRTQQNLDRVKVLRLEITLKALKLVTLRKSVFDPLEALPPPYITALDVVPQQHPVTTAAITSDVLGKAGQVSAQVPNPGHTVCVRLHTWERSSRGSRRT